METNYKETRTFIGYICERAIKSKNASLYACFTETNTILIKLHAGGTFLQIKQLKNEYNVLNDIVK